MRCSIPLLAALTALAACAGLGPAVEVSPSEIPALEAQRQEHPEDGDVLVRLGAAYRAAGRLDDAVVALSDATALEEPPAAAWAVLGAVAEDREDWQAAANAYEQYLDAGGAAADQVTRRLAVVRHRMLAVEARNALAREAQLSQEPPVPSTVAVMPLVVDGPPEYEPLGRGLAEMLTTDLSITNRLQVLERARLQALLEEMRLGLAGYTDPATAARAGRLLRAQTIVQGRVEVPATPQDEARVQALVVEAGDPGEPRSADQAGALESLMDMEARLALAIYRELGITLTAAEESRLLERPTANLQAFLAYSQGLSALDRNDFSSAAEAFRSATQLDPGFQAAATAATEAENLATAPPPSAVTGRAAPRPGLAQAAGGGPPGVENIVDAAVPAGAAAATPTAGPLGQSPASGTPPAENTETTAGTGVKVVRTVPVVLIRPSGLLVPWRLR